MYNPVLCCSLSFLQHLKPLGSKNKSGCVGHESAAESVLQDEPRFVVLRKAKVMGDASAEGTKAGSSS